MYKYFIYISIFVCVVACSKVTPFSSAPQIEHVSLNYKLSQLGSAPVKLGLLSFTLVDGDADIGRGSMDSVQNDSTQTGIHLWLLVPDSVGVLAPVEDTIFEYLHYQFPEIEEYQVGGQIKARIDLEINAYSPVFFVYDTIAYRYFVVDKAGNKSNMVFSEMAVLLL